MLLVLLSRASFLVIPAHRLCSCSSGLSGDSGWVWEGWERAPTWCLHHFLISLWPTCFWKPWSWRNRVACAQRWDYLHRQHFLLHSGSRLDLFLPSQCWESQELQIDKTKTWSLTPIILEVSRYFLFYLIFFPSAAAFDGNVQMVSWQNLFSVVIRNRLKTMKMLQSLEKHKLKIWKCPKCGTECRMLWPFDKTEESFVFRLLGNGSMFDYLPSSSYLKVIRVIIWGFSFFLPLSITGCCWLMLRSHYCFIWVCISVYLCVCVEKGRGDD